MKNKLFKFKKIRTKLIAYLVTISITPLIISSILFYYQIKNSETIKLKQTTSQTLTKINDGVTIYFKNIENQTSLLSTDENIINVDNNPIAAINSKKLIEETQKNWSKEFCSVEYGTESGKFIEYPNVKLPDDYDFKTRPWYTTALEHKGEVVVTKHFKDAGTGVNIASVTKTVEVNGKTIGVISIDIDLSYLSNLLGDSKLGSNGYITISESDGDVLYHPDSSLINTSVLTTLPCWDDIRKNKHGNVDYKYNGVNKFGAFETNSITGWVIMGVLQEDEFTSAILGVRYIEIIIFITLILTIIVSIVISKPMTTNMIKLKEAFSKSSSGDLTSNVNIDSNDEFGDLGKYFNIMMKDISDLMISVKHSADVVLSTADTLSGMAEETRVSIDEVSKAIEEVSQGATEQSQTAQCEVNDMEILSSKIDNINNISNTMNNMSLTTQQLSSKGLVMIDTLNKKSTMSKEATNKVYSIINEMNTSVGEINDISYKLSFITERTNLLSLNAQIEAARVGEAGKGFAVVAEEVKKLAEQSQKSTDEIKSIISNVQNKSQLVVNSITETSNIVNDQELTVSEANEIFNDIISSVSEMTTKINSMKIYVSEINNKKDAVLSQIENSSAISEETASASEEVTASTEQINLTMGKITKYTCDLQTLSMQLQEKVSKFNI